jgi:ABC-type dipeptide/oligopeptide/nickel transport system ATPase component
MGYFRPKVVYTNPNEERKNSIVRYIAARVLRENKNFLCALVGSTGSGKSWAALSICEQYSKLTGIEFNPNIHVISSLKELLQLITNKDVGKKIKVGTAILFDEPQTEANSRSWQSEINQAFNALMSTFRNQRLIVFFALPYLEMIDKQSRMLFHGEFKVDGFDRNTKITTIKPRFLEYNKNIGNFYRKRLIVEYALPNKKRRGHTLVHTWHIDKPSDAIVEVYETKKKAFTDELNRKLLDKIELKEKVNEGKNKNEEFTKIKDLYDKYGEDYLKIFEEMPYMNPRTVQGYIYLIKKSRGLTYRRQKTASKI